MGGTGLGRGNAAAASPPEHKAGDQLASCCPFLASGDDDRDGCRRTTGSMRQHSGRAGGMPDRASACGDAGRGVCPGAGTPAAERRGRFFPPSPAQIQLQQQLPQQRPVDLPVDCAARTAAARVCARRMTRRSGPCGCSVGGPLPQRPPAHLARRFGGPLIPGRCTRQSLQQLLCLPALLPRWSRQPGWGRRVGRRRGTKSGRGRGWGEEGRGRGGAWGGEKTKRKIDSDFSNRRGC